MTIYRLCKVHGEDGLGDVPTLSPSLEKSDFDAHEKGEHAAEAIVRLAREQKGVRKERSCIYHSIQAK